MRYSLKSTFPIARMTFPSWAQKRALGVYFCPSKVDDTELSLLGRLDFRSTIMEGAGGVS